MFDLIGRVMKYMKKHSLLDKEKVECHLIMLRASVAMSLFKKHGTGEQLVYDFRSEIVKHLALAEVFFKSYSDACVALPPSDFLLHLTVEITRMRVVARQAVEIIAVKLAK